MVGLWLRRSQLLPDSNPDSSAEARSGRLVLALYGFVGWRDRAEAAFVEQGESVPAGVRRHAGVAVISFLLLMTPNTIMEFAGGALAGFFLLRTRATWRLWGSSLIQRVPLVIFAWVAWQFITLLWSPDPRLGLDEIADLRWATLIVLIWPVIRYRRQLIAALAVSFLLGHVSQLTALVGPSFGWTLWVRTPDRISGWWDPAVSGTLLTAALGLHLPAAFMGAGRTRIIGVVMSAVTLIGLMLTGTRGAWIASAGLIGVVALVALWASPHRKRLMLVLVVMAAAVVLAGVALRGPIMGRVNNAREEITLAIEHKQFKTSTGTRIIMYWWAIEAFADHPVGGVGAGGYHAWVDQHLIDQDIDPADRYVLDHAHCAILHVAATSGLIGLFIAGTFIVVALRSAFAHIGQAELGTYMAGPGFALVGLLLASAFDTVHINTQSAALLSALLALSPAWLPREARP